MATRERLDVLVWQRGLAPSRAKARALILAGQIAVNGECVTRAGTPIEPQATLTRLGTPSAYVSRGGEKLAAALAVFDLTVHGRVAILETSLRQVPHPRQTGYCVPQLASPYWRGN